MPYDANGNWYEEHAPTDPFSGLFDGIRGLFNRGGGGAPPAAAEVDTPPPPLPEPTPGDSNSAANAEFDEQLRQKRDMELRQAAANIARTEADTERLRRDAAKAAVESDPATQRARQAQAEAQADLARLQLERLRAELSPQDLAVLQNELALARQRAQQDFDAGRDQSRQEFEAREGQLGRDFTAGESALSRGFTAQQNELNRGVQTRGQEIERLKAQDDWVLGILRQQVAEGTLSLQRATNMFSAYVERARLPSQIMESVSRAIEPFSASIPAKGYVPPGFEKGGPMQGLYEAGGGKGYKPPDEHKALKDSGVDLFKLAKKAGAQFGDTKIPDPGKVFGSIPIPQTNFAAFPSALANFPAAQFGGTAPPPPPPMAAPAGPVGSMASQQSDWQMSDEQIARLNALLDTAQ